MQRRVVELLGRVEHRQLTQLLLAVNDNINNQLLRYERYNNNIPPAAAAAASAVTSTDDVLLEVAAGPGECSVLLHAHTVAMPYLMLAVNEFSLSVSPIGGAMALEPEKPKPDFQVTVPLFTFKLNSLCLQSTYCKNVFLRMWISLVLMSQSQKSLICRQDMKTQ